MAIIYTISHPLTNDIVYVGATKNLKSRARNHINSKTDLPVAQWIVALRNNFMLPKIEIIDIADSDEIMALEHYWIGQLTSWGFNLLNKNKTNKAKKTIRVVSKKTNRSYLTTERTRKSKRWSVADVEIGSVHIIDNTFAARRVFTASFKNYCRKYDVSRYLHYSIVDDKLHAVVKETKISADAPFGFTKSGRKRYQEKMNKPKVDHRPVMEKFSYDFGSVKEGDATRVKFLKYESFKLCLAAYNKRHAINIRYKLDYVENEDYLNITYVLTDAIINNPQIPRHLIRRGKSKIGKPGAQSKLSDAQKEQISISKDPIRVLAIKYDISESSVYKIKYKKNNP